METINSLVMAVSIVICLGMLAYLVRWYAWKRVKSASVRKNVMNFSWIQATVLIVVLLVNGIVLDVRHGEAVDYYPLVPIGLSVIFGYMCREVLLRNYQKKVVEGTECCFVVANVLETELQGYAVLEGNNWLQARALIAPNTWTNYEEHQQVAVVICSVDPDGEFITVKI